MVHMSWRDPSRLAPEGGVRYLRVTHPFPGEFRITLVVLLWIKADGAMVYPFAYRSRGSLELDSNLLCGGIICTVALRSCVWLALALSASACHTRTHVSSMRGNVMRLYHPSSHACCIGSNKFCASRQCMPLGKYLGAFGARALKDPG